MSIPIPILFAMALVGLVVGAIFLVGLTKRWGILISFVGMFLFGSMSLPLDWRDRINPTVWLPIQTHRSTLFLACGVLGMIMLVFQLGRLRGKRLTASAFMLLFVGLFAAFLRIFHNGPQDGAMSVVFSFCTLLPLMVAMPLVVERPDDLRTIVRAVILANLIWVGMVFVQVVVNPRFVTMGNEFRFVGLYSNPQHAGVLMAFFTVIALWALLNESRRYTLFLVAIVGVNGLLLLWTGSRTGLGMAIIGVSATLYSRAGRSILLLPIAGIVGYVGLKVMVNVLGLDLGFQRLASTANTRDEAWRTLMRVALENPILGAGTEGAEKSENSWLYGFASYGIGMLVLLLTLTFVTSIEILKSMYARFRVPAEYRNYMDFMIGVLLMYFAGAVLEGYMITRVSSTLCVFMVFAVANVNIRKMLLAQEDGLLEYEESWTEYDEPYGDYDDEQVGYAS